ncbi:unnamed protein product [Orchesella dallaii]|uniref:F-box domain-containing protein n=1 Tax=Orchesella dallaii TaxID=48710 RepID=A0ABP1R1F7_9HEXA
MCMNGKYFLRYCLIFLLATPTFSINPKGTSKIGSPCKPEKYKKYILPFQRAVLTDSAYAASPDIIRDYNADKATDPNIDKLLCDTRGHPMAFQTHLQCDDNTNSCVCLAISDLRINTEQIIGTTGCLAVPGSWCQEDAYKLTCGYAEDSEASSKMNHEIDVSLPENTSKVSNPFDVLPYEMLAEVFSNIDAKERQKFRKVCNVWKYVIDIFHGIHLNVTNMNWNSMEDCDYAKTVRITGFSRDVLRPIVITSRLVNLEITDFIAYYSLLPLLEECNMLESLFINCATFLPKSRLQEYSSNEYFERKGKSDYWMPRLKVFKFTSVTTKSGVYNHLIPGNVPDDLGGLEDTIRTFDVSRGEMEFIPLIMRILMGTKTLQHVEMSLSDIWKIPFADLLQVSVDIPPLTQDISLWHFGSKQLLPVGVLLHKLNSLSTMCFRFPHHLNAFLMKFKPLSTQQLQNRNEPYQLEEVIVQQSLRWSQEMREVDIPWLQILEKQFYLQKLEYPFPVTGDDERIAEIITQNCKTLKSIVFMGHRENQNADLGEWFGTRRPPWDAEWFAECEQLQELQLKNHTRFLGLTHISSLTKPNLLPHSLTHLVFHGCIDIGRSSICIAFCNLLNLHSFTHQARLCPWFMVAGVPITELQVSHAKEILGSLTQLKTWRLEWCDSSSALMTHFVLNPQSQIQAGYISKQVWEWMQSVRSSIEFQDTNLDRQMKGLTINILSHQNFNL